ncbi:MAG TPA: hypothetical protein VL461_12250 [Dictyobacter sp.]|nr:hypothetical protein [Dictyobacter sp.]
MKKAEGSGKATRERIRELCYNARQGRLTTVEQTLEAMKNQVDQRLNTVDSRLDRVETMLSQILERLPEAP